MEIPHWALSVYCQYVHGYYINHSLIWTLYTTVDVDKEYLEMCTFPLSTLVTTHWAVVNYRCISIEPVYTEMYGLLV